MTPQEEIKQLIDKINDELAHLHSVHLTFMKLYRGDQETRDLIHDSDSAFFHDLLFVYLDYISISVSRLLDPEKSMGKWNLSLFTLASMTRDFGLDKAQDYKTRFTECKKKAYNFTEPRNQLVAHLDFDTNISSKGRCIPSFITDEFNEFYETIAGILNDIRKDIGLDPYMYEWGIVGHGHGGKLLSRLKTAQKYFEQAHSSKPLPATPPEAG